MRGGTFVLARDFGIVLVLLTPLAHAINYSRRHGKQHFLYEIWCLPRNAFDKQKQEQRHGFAHSPFREKRQSLRSTEAKIAHVDNNKHQFDRQLSMD